MGRWFMRTDGQDAGLVGCRLAGQYLVVPLHVAAADVVVGGVGKAVSSFLAATIHQRLEGHPGGLGPPTTYGPDLRLCCSRQPDVDGRVRLTGSNSLRAKGSSRRTRPASTSPKPAATSSPARTARSRSALRTTASRARSSRQARSSSTTLLVTANGAMPTRTGREPAIACRAPAWIHQRTVGVDTPSTRATSPTLAPRSRSATCSRTASSDRRRAASRSCPASCCSAIRSSTTPRTRFATQRTPRPPARGDLLTPDRTRGIRHRPRSRP